MTAGTYPASISAKKYEEERDVGKNLALLRLLAKAFIWIGAVGCAAYLLLALPSVSSFSSLLLIVIDTIGRLSATVGLGAVLLALAEIADGLRNPGREGTQLETPRN